MGLISNATVVFDAGTLNLGGSLTFIKKLTASSSGTLTFHNGASSVVLDDTFKEYVFTFKNIHPSANGAELLFQGNAAGGSGFDETITSTGIESFHKEDNSGTPYKAYSTYFDKAQATSFQSIAGNPGNGNDESSSGIMHLFNPSSTTFVKHFTTNFHTYNNNDGALQLECAGYFNTTSAIDEIQFKMDSGNIDSGDICLYGIK